MRCLKCGSKNIKVADTQKFDTVIVMIRQDLNRRCLYAWPTKEEKADNELRPEILSEPNIWK